MAKVIGEVEPSEKVYHVELTQSELDIIAGLLLDLTDHRSVYMVYPVDGDAARPTPKAFDIIQGASQALMSHQDIDYNYFDYWQTLTDDEIHQIDAKEKPFRF